MNNCINLTGRLVEDPEIKKISERARVCNFTLASQRDRKGEDGKCL